MQFNSLQFLIFFPIVVAVFFVIPHRFRWLFLLAASYYFYMCWKSEYIILIIVSTLIDYFAGIQMGETGNKVKRRKYLILSLIGNLGILFSFKYANFFSGSLKLVLNQFNIFYEMPAFDLLLPVGISFYTFQSLSYSIDVYRGERKPERHLGKFALYVAFFPQLVAGPIERSTRLLPQFYKTVKFDYERFMSGLRLMLWGFFKKLVIADRLAIYVNEAYNHPSEYNSFTLILATHFFAFQIYCDFSGYSDIAIGAAQVMGYNLMENFKRPYFSKSISEFWKRWHISLSTWFRDYLYIPLGGNRVAKWRWYYNLFVVFLLSGLWHGANWTFVIWGALHGFYLVFSIWTSNLRKKITAFLHIDKFPIVQKWIKILIIYHLVVLSWVFFRANSLSDAFYIFSHFFSGPWRELPFGDSLGIGAFQFLLCIFLILLLELVQLIQEHKGIFSTLIDKPVWIRWSVSYAMILSIVFLGAPNHSEFIYFQF